MLRSRKLFLITGNKGYLLFEVLLSLVILSAGLILVSRSFVSSLSALKVSKGHTQAVLMLERKLAEIESGVIDIQGYSKIDLDGEEGGFNWKIRSEEPGEEIMSKLPYTEVQVTVSWAERNVEREVKASVGISP
jgi:hypothetical protein